MSPKAGWYPDPGGGVGLFRFWDGRAWSAATTNHPESALPPTALGAGQTPPAGPAGYGQGNPNPGNPSQGNHNPGVPYQGGVPGPGAGGPEWGPQPYGRGAGGPTGPGAPLGGAGSYGGQGAYSAYAQQGRKRSPVGWWIGAAALLVVIVVVAVVAIRAIGNGTLAGGNGGGGQGTEQVCPPDTSLTTPLPHPNDGRVYGGPLSYPALGSPWSSPRLEDRVPFGSDVETQTITVEPNYQPNNNWVASVLVGELQAGDGFYTPEQGSQIVVRCILGKFYGDNPVTSDVKVNQATTIDGHEGWLVESQLSFDIPGLTTKGELLIVAIVSAGERSGLYYASIPDTTPQLVAPARALLQELRVED